MSPAGWRDGGGAPRRAMLAQDRDVPAAVDARFLALMPPLEAAVRDHNALSSRPG